MVLLQHGRITRHPSPVQIMIDQKQMENV